MMRWLKDNLVWIVLVVGCFLGFLVSTLFRKDVGTFQQLVDYLKFEKKVIDQKARVAKEQAKKGHDIAVAGVMEQYEDQIRKMSEVDKRMVSHFSNDPEQLVEFILRNTEEPS